MKRTLLLLLILIFALPLLGSCTKRDNSFADAVTLSKRSVSLTSIGDVVTLSARVFIDYRELTAEETEGKITWSSSDMGVAICNDGVVEVLGYGNCVIRATYESGISATCTVSIPNPNSTLTISHSELTLANIGRVANITATSDKGEDITEIVTWISSNNNIVRCVDGMVTAVGYGSCTITAISPVESKTAICSVTVGDPTAPYVEIKGAKHDNLALEVGDEATVSAEIKNGAGTSIAWATSDPSIAICDGGVIRAVGRGVCAVLAMTERGYTDYVIVSVGDVTPVHGHEEYLKFNFNNVGRELLYIDGETGQTVSRSLILSYRMDTLLLEDGRLVVEIYLNCVKTFDKDGLTGSSAAVISTDLYRENDVLCLENLYKSPVKVGETFTVECQGFTVQTGTNISPRRFYMTFSTISQE